METPGGCTFCRNVGEVLIERATWPRHAVQVTKPCPECAKDAEFIYKRVRAETLPDGVRVIHVDYLLRATLETIRVQVNGNGDVLTVADA